MRISDWSSDVCSSDLTNPDMLHVTLLPNHKVWQRIFTNLKYVVIDEAHTYTGRFGSHVAGVLRRVVRVCAHYGSAPQFICSAGERGVGTECVSTVRSWRSPYDEEKNKVRHRRE